MKEVTVSSGRFFFHTRLAPLCCIVLTGCFCPTQIHSGGEEGGASHSVTLEVK